MSRTFPLTDLDSEFLTARTDRAADLRSPRRRHQPTGSRVELDSGEFDVGPMHIVLATARPADVQPDEERRFVIVAGDATRRSVSGAAVRSELMDPHGASGDGFMAHS